jgi:sensor histidine kinase YesM
MLAGLNSLFLPVRMGMISSIIMRGAVVIVMMYLWSKNLIEAERKNALLLENQQLKHDNVLFQLNALKNQLNPHFLFNSLNTLSWLINQDTAKSQEYLQKLSQVLRYSLSMQEQQLVSLKDELILVENYVFLLQMRFGIIYKSTLVQ